MADYRNYRDIVLNLDDLGWKLKGLPTAYDNDQFELNKRVELEHIREGINLILSSTNVHHDHWCPDSDYLLVTEYDAEAKSCQCNQRATRTPDPDLLPF